MIFDILNKKSLERQYSLGGNFYIGHFGQNIYNTLNSWLSNATGGIYFFKIQLQT